MPQIVATCSGSAALHRLSLRGASHCLSCDFISFNQLALHKLIDLLHVAAVAGVNIVVVAVAAVAVFLNKSAAAATVA